LKDRLYTYPASHPARRSAQTVLFELADRLCRLMAPVLAFTSEEIWQELETQRGGEGWATSSVHTRLFPAAASIPEDRGLLERWERLQRIRDEVFKALELARAAKTIGTSLEATVVIEDGGDGTAEFLQSFGEDLRFLFITSGVELGTVAAEAFRSDALPGLAVEVRRAPGSKCERCWNYTTDVGSSADWPTICLRCEAHVRAALSETESA
jgi:isoleucyl-tRNA synthetase